MEVELVYIEGCPKRRGRTPAHGAIPLSVERMCARGGAEMIGTIPEGRQLGTVHSD